MELWGWLLELLRQIGRNVVSTEWLANELPSFLVFTALIGWAVSRFEGWRERRERRPYEGWHLVVIGFDDPPQALYFEDVRKLLYSEFELFRFVKTVCTTICEIRTTSLAEAQKSWVFVNREKREFVIDFVKLPEEQRKDWRISGDPLTKLERLRAEHAGRNALLMS